MKCWTGHCVKVSEEMTANMLHQPTHQPGLTLASKINLLPEYDTTLQPTPALSM